VRGKRDLPRHCSWHARSEPLAASSGMRQTPNQALPGARDWLEVNVPFPDQPLHLTRPVGNLFDKGGDIVALHPQSLHH
jgi:hypothetical protein